ncbi:hypothetical protein TRIATDRAFT_81471 [Trichoderma atroviride IMI 206040]|uniref:Survival Motor Neuron Gemin2-binding domain-containing protein n=1 Tax=Hypocrea atroviridis (strain ATCC 20476 / IMI 206040) TaxID=452589 RepID=G9NQ27_HYPAI|nr:uncharacterized protein TRIATDRAFT_81471 [Trichoderma atroviride IMI 206040]EHK47179.1 hypothetical protein TRIATDRAFT_81471 [Trichoderma atroviride IMI 206040]
MNIDESDPQHEEVWDDSLLIDSWNQALQEYKKYHSIHAKGGSIRDLEQAEAASSKADEALKTEESANELSVQTQKEHEEPPSKDDAVENTEEHSKQPGHSSNSIPSAFPSQAILGTVRDDNLKKLLMSWYYAGYYTGLFEGQQQAQQQQQPGSQ